MNQKALETEKENNQRAKLISTIMDTLVTLSAEQLLIVRDHATHVRKIR